MARINRFKKEISRRKRVSVDSSVFIYQFEQSLKFQPLTNVVFEALSENAIHLITSVITVSEVLIQPLRIKNIEAVRLYEGVFSQLPNFTLVSIDCRLAKIAAQIRAENNIFLPDAYQIASALSSNADIFITNDTALKKITEIRVICLKNYI